MAIALAGLIATGSRGPWIGTANALLLAIIIIPWRRPATRRSAMVLAAAGIVGIALSWVIGQDMIRHRVDEAQKEVHDARQQRVYWTSTGLRIGLWDWAAEVWRGSPVFGVGAGGFPGAYQSLESFKQACNSAREDSMRAHVVDYAAAVASGRDVTQLRGYRRTAREYEAKLDYLARDHAHSTYMHTLASEGAVGLALLFAVLITMGWQCWRDRPDHPYSDGMLFVLLCWSIGALFDCYELNGHQLGLLTFVMALTLPGRAAVRWSWSAVDKPIGDSGVPPYDRPL